ncbi:hypothetical protein EVAR_39273_1 [Eumeta japonica]|uniref:Reverse transcriptase domain-containing protein n=1 Tax=Eumeta variegata TaxID=151549 RepID=A0A4C1VVF6_EUMVA|nr:hypothetical protein EVAR_39273_1 [Eumeta japonica]
MSKKQFNFTRGRSIINDGVELVEIILETSDGSRNAIGVFCDLSKAFVCVNDETLIRNNTDHYGVTDRVLDLLTLYLTNRVQRSDVNNMRSSGSVIRMEVP